MASVQHTQLTVVECITTDYDTTAVAIKEHIVPLPPF